MDDPSDAEVDAVLEEFDGDWRETIRALLHDIAVLAVGFTESVSNGYVRGRVTAVSRLSTKRRRDES